MATDQGVLANMMEGEDFNAPDEHFFDAEELLHNEEHRSVCMKVQMKFPDYLFLRRLWGACPTL